MKDKKTNEGGKIKNHIGQGVKINLAMELPKKPEKPKPKTEGNKGKE